jgi:hypothetical protein
MTESQPPVLGRVPQPQGAVFMAGTLDLVYVWDGSWVVRGWKMGASLGCSMAEGSHSSLHSIARVA